jgi:hypothetical protein
MRQTAPYRQLPQRVLVTLSAIFMALIAFGAVSVFAEGADDPRVSFEVSELTETSAGGPDGSTTAAIGATYQGLNEPGPAHWVAPGPTAASSFSADILSIAPKLPPPVHPQHA